MELTLSAILAATLFFGVLATGGVLLTRGPGDVVLIFVLVFGLFYGFRPMLFVLGLDVPYPEELFHAGTPELLTKTLLGLTLYLSVALLAIAVITHSRAGGWAPFFVDREVDVSRALRVTVALTAVAGVVSAFLLVKYGGIGGVIAAAKVEKSLAGLYALKAIPAVGAVIAVATFIDARKRRDVSLLVARTALACSFANAFFVFLWGSRSVFIIVGATLVLGLRSRRPRTRQQRQKVLARLLLAVMLVVVAASGMRMVRDTLTRGEVQETYAEASVWRQASVGTNSVYFDAAMLSFRDWPSSYPFRNGEDFVKGAVGVVPRLVWEDKPTAIPPGKWFRQVYEPHKVNGWPMGAAAVWFLNFGWPGLLLGGLLSGFAVGLIAAGQRRRPSNGFNTAVAVITGVYVLAMGWDSQVLIKFIVWLVPVWVIARYVAPRRPSRRSQRAKRPRAGSGVNPGKTLDTSAENLARTTSASTLR